MRRPRVFVGSSSAGEVIGLALQRGLESVADVTLWSQGAFGLSEGNLQALVRTATEFDFAILVLTQDDLRLKDDEIRAVPRDNVLFELGLFIGKLGPSRTFIVYDKKAPPTLPSDLAGVTAATYTGRDGGKELFAAVGPAYAVISQSIRELEALPTETLDTHPLSPELRAIATSTADALNLDHQAFREEVRARVTSWREEAQVWTTRKFVVRENYTNVLGAVYRHAKREIFSTSVPSYLGFWHSPFGQNILDYQRNNRNARSIRVFILRSRADITPEMEKVFAIHTQNRLAVRVFLEEEPRDNAQGFMFPPELGKDWTIVDDGEVIGITQKFGEHWEAEWHVNNVKEAERFRAYKQRLIDASYPYEGA